ncbi:MAG: tetratricopeptide repeat protein [Candidatus Hodarchaeota archaeon]
MKTQKQERTSTRVFTGTLRLLFLICLPFSSFVDQLKTSAFAQEDTIRMRISIILVKTKPEAQRVLQKLEAGTEFEELARKYSIGPGKEEGGDLGYFAPDEIREGLNVVAVNLRIGEHSGIIEISEGYLILVKTDEGFSAELSSLEIGAQLSFKTHYNRGWESQEKREYDRAITEYTKALEIDPQHGMTYFQRGNAHYKKGYFSQAIADYTKALELGPQHATLYFTRGTARYRKGDFDEAIADYTRALEIDPDFADAYVNRGNAYYRKGEFGRAIADYSAALEINPHSAEAYYNRGEAWYEMSNIEKALADGIRARSLKQTNKALQGFVDSLSPATVTEKHGAQDVSWTSTDWKNASNSFFYGLHIASFRKLVTVRKEIERLTEKGLYAWWRKVHVPDKGEWIRVYIEKKGSRIEAQELGKMLKASGIIDYFAVHRFKKTTG